MTLTVRVNEPLNGSSQLSRRQAVWLHHNVLFLCRSILSKPFLKYSDIEPGMVIEVRTHPAFDIYPPYTITKENKNAFQHDAYRLLVDPYPSMHCRGGGYLTGGVYLPGGVYLAGGLPARGVPAPGGYLPSYSPLWTEWQTGAKILPCPKLRLRTVIINLPVCSVKMNFRNKMLHGIMQSNGSSKSGIKKEV